RATNFTVEAEDGDAVHRIVVIRRLDHVVLLVTAEPMLRTERSAHTHVPERGQCVQGVEEIACQGGGMGQQSHASAREGFAQFRLIEKAVDSKLHSGSSSTKPSE